MILSVGLLSIAVGVLPVRLLPVAVRVLSVRRLPIAVRVLSVRLLPIAVRVLPIRRLFAAIWGLLSAGAGLCAWILGRILPIVLRVWIWGWFCQPLCGF